ncbi:MAG TPA: DNRLRE domain-containing protein, partial [Candidatus Acidoferrales bacterium]|nr:DNRLRE domain-containing protein [Candidatus Acidoferrales bacterium]
MKSTGKDTWLDQGNPTTNHGTDTTLRVQSSNAQNQRAIVMIDLSAIPRSGIKAATLTLFLSTAPSANETYEIDRIISFWTETDAAWSVRLPSSTAWGVAGGDHTSTGSAVFTTGTTSGVFLAPIDVTKIVQRYFSSVDSSGTPVPNYGFIIFDTTENQLTARTGSFSSRRDVVANRPSLSVTFIQHVTGLTAAPGNAQIALSWTFPPQVPGSTIGSATNGVLILRKAGSPMGSAAVPTDGTVPTVGTLIGDGTVAFVDASSATTFTDTGLTNDTTYYYRVFTRDAANNWSASTPPVLGGAATNVPEITATPSATVANQLAARWMLPTGATTLAAPGIDPGTVAVVGSNTNLFQGANPGTGTDVFAPASTGGVISGRPPVLRAADDSLALPATFVPNQDNFVYAINSSTGALIRLTNPTGLTTNNFVGGAGVVVKSFATAAYTLAQDLVVVGTHNTASPTTNQIVGINPNTGTAVWSVVGGTSSSLASCGGVCNMDIVNSTPAVDYVNNAIWVTTRNGNTPAGTANRPDLWKIDANTGAILGAVNLGGDIDSSPTLDRASQFVLVGTNSGSLLAINPTTLATVATFTPTPADGPVKGFPVLAS